MVPAGNLDNVLVLTCSDEGRLLVSRASRHSRTEIFTEVKKGDDNEWL